MTLEKLLTKIPDCRAILVGLTSLITVTGGSTFYWAMKIDEPTLTKLFYSGATLAFTALTAYLANKFYR